MEMMDDAAWDFESIKWYDKLLMFATEYPIKQIELCNGDELCVLSEKSPGLCVLNLYSLPPRLKKLKKEEESLTKNNDLKIRGGTFVSNHVSRLACVYGKKYLYTSEEGVEGVKVYSSNGKESDKILLNGTIKTRGLNNPEIKAKGDLLVAVGNTNQHILTLNNNGDEIASHRWDKSTVADRLAVDFLTDNTIITCTSTKRKAHIFDIRQKEPSVILPGESGGFGWTVKSNHSEWTPPSVTRVGFLGENGWLRVYDSRWWSDACFVTDLGYVTNDDADTGVSRRLTPCLGFDPGDPRAGRLSVSGLDSRVYIVETSPSFRVAFTHSGHEHSDACRPRRSTTVSHLWYPHGERGTVISAALNASINCWTYNLLN